MLFISSDIATAAAVMAASVPLRNVPLLALGALAMFGYVTSAAVRYLKQSLGYPSALAISGVLIIGLAVVSARLCAQHIRPSPASLVRKSDRIRHFRRSPPSRARKSHHTQTSPRPRRQALSPVKRLRSVRDFARKEWPPSGAVQLT